MQKLRGKIYQLLRWSEQYTKTDMIYLAQGGFWLIAAKIVSLLASFCTSIAFANLLLPETYGTYRYILSVFGFLTITTLVGLDTAITRTVAKGNDGSIVPVLKTKIKWGLLGGLIGIGLGLYYYFQHNYIIALCIFIASVFLPIMDPLYLFTAVLNGKKLFKISTKYNATIRILTSLAIITALFLTSNIFIILLVYFVSNTLLRLIFSKLTFKKINLMGPQDPTAISYGKHLTLMSLLGQLSTYLDKILIFHYAGGSALAIYYFAQTPFKQVQGILNTFNILALPKFSAAEVKTLKSTLPKKLFKSYLMIILIVIIYIFTAPYLFKIFYPQYLKSVFLSQLFILLLLLFPINLFSSALTSQSQTKKLYISTTTYAIIRSTLLMILVPVFGIYGAAATILLSNLISAVQVAYLFFRMT